MKKRTLLYIILIVVCVAGLFLYRTIRNISSDTVSPRFSLSEEVLTLSVSDNEDVLLSGITASDDKDGDVSSKIIIESVKLTDKNGKAKVTYAVYDSFGNTSKCEREVIYSDYRSPVFSLSTSLTFAQNSNFDVLSCIKVNDIFDGDISHHVRATPLDDSSISSVGVHEVEFKVTNSVGDTAELVLPIEVYSQGSYNASLKLTDYIVYIPLGSSFDEEDYLSSFVVGTNSTDISSYLPSGYTLRTEGGVDTSVPGVYNISYFVTYQSREAGSVSAAAYKGFAKLTVVVEE